MESNYSNRDFEQFVKQNADQYRMFPSEKVWKNIHSTLHTRRRWYGAGLAFLLLLTAGSVTWVMLTSPVSEKQQATVNEKSQVNNVSRSSISEASAINHKDKKIDINNLLVFNDEANTSFGQQPVLTVPENNTSSTNVIPDESKINHYDASSSHPENLTNESELTQVIVTRNIDDQLSSLPVQNKIIPSTKGDNEVIEAVEIKKDNVAVSENQADIYPLSIESVTNAYHPNNFGKKLKWQLFITPTISYRQLTANNSVDNTNSSSGYPYSGLGDVNNAVTHRPDLGVQIGLSAGYPVSENLKIRGGVQFNVNRYDIKAFAYNPEIATIVDDAGGSTISAWTNYRNYGGYRTDWLKNFYFSVSAPIGAELKLLGNEKTSWGIAGTIQPTYILKDKAYLISTDYKNYAKVPWLVRRVNLSTSFETFVVLGSDTKWQIGPQVRYQVLSSFQNKYPVKEHLFDFGLKVGVFLND